MAIAADGGANVTDVGVDIEKSACVGQPRVGRRRNEERVAVRRTSPGHVNGGRAQQKQARSDGQEANRFEGKKKH